MTSRRRVAGLARDGSPLRPSPKIPPDPETVARDRRLPHRPGGHRDRATHQRLLGRRHPHQLLRHLAQHALAALGHRPGPGRKRPGLVVASARSRLSPASFFARSVHV
ncbi:hypothetical protein [Nonomuraea diastatica]|uniref:Uncharacterized protein n=1 Tax=Nonomuraea diastatica TaxID=1848329 RepID=A0A4R4X5R5_9ACTN|nr:hypothetical protein [Nonomuraea diastatica]TDD25741.1 hypothetical protein E1294_02155 [Nonomuraea diastatica]